MNSSVLENEPAATKVTVTPEHLLVELADGRGLRVDRKSVV